MTCADIATIKAATDIRKKGCYKAVATERHLGVAGTSCLSVCHQEWVLVPVLTELMR